VSCIWRALSTRCAISRSQTNSFSALMFCSSSVPRFSRWSADSCIQPADFNLHSRPPPCRAPLVSHGVAKGIRKVYSLTQLCKKYTSYFVTFQYSFLQLECSPMLGFYCNIISDLGLTASNNLQADSVPVISKFASFREFQL